MRSYLDLPRQVDLNAELRFVGQISGEDVPAYVDGNIHVSRPIRRGVRLNVTLENLLHRRRGNGMARTDWRKQEVCAPASNRDSEAVHRMTWGAQSGWRC